MWRYSKVISMEYTQRYRSKVKRSPFGTKPACSIFQRVIEKVLQGLKGVKNFLDDIIVTGVDNEDHLNNFREVFKRLLDGE